MWIDYIHFRFGFQLDEVNDFDTRKAIRKRMAELKEPEGEG